MQKTYPTYYCRGFLCEYCQTTLGRGGDIEQYVLNPENKQVDDPPHTKLETKHVWNVRIICMEQNYVISSFFQKSNQTWIRLALRCHQINDNHMCICICMYVIVYVHIHTLMSDHICTHTHIYIYIYILRILRDPQSLSNGHEDMFSAKSILEHSKHEQDMEALEVMQSSIQKSCMASKECSLSNLVMTNSLLWTTAIFQWREFSHQWWFSIAMLVITRGHPTWQSRCFPNWMRWATMYPTYITSSIDRKPTPSWNSLVIQCRCH